MEVKFDDKDVVLTISTPKGRIIKLDDKAGEIKIVDPFNNQILMTKDKVDIFSAADMNLTSTKNMTIECGANLKVHATAQYSLASPVIKANADTSFAIESSAMGEIKTGAILTVTGALVKIN
jgi:hypothetical protein